MKSAVGHGAVVSRVSGHRCAPVQAASGVVGVVWAVTVGVGRGAAGEGEEDLVERRAAQADVVDVDAGVGEGPHGVGQAGGAVVDGHGDPAGRLVDRAAPRCRAGPAAGRRGRGRRRGGRGSRPCPGRPGPSARRACRWRWPGRGRRSRRGRRAGRPPRGTASSAARRCRRGRAPGWRPTARCGCAGRARSSARRAAAAGACRRGWRRGRAAGACRRSSAARGGRRRR